MVLLKKIHLLNVPPCHSLLGGEVVEEIAEKKGQTFHPLWGQILVFWSNWPLMIFFFTPAKRSTIGCWQMFVFWSNGPLMMWFWHKRSFLRPKIVYRFISPSLKHFQRNNLSLLLFNFWIKWEWFLSGNDFVEALLL